MAFLSIFKLECIHIIRKNKVKFKALQPLPLTKYLLQYDVEQQEWQICKGKKVRFKK